MSNFKQYRRKSISEMRPVTQADIDQHKAGNRIINELQMAVSISHADLENGSPKIGDMIARNPKDHKDQWLVAKAYFEDNLEEII